MNHPFCISGLRWYLLIYAIIRIGSLEMSLICAAQQETIMTILLYRINNQFRRKKLRKHSKHIVALLKIIVKDSTIFKHFYESPYCMKIALSTPKTTCTHHQLIAKISSTYIDILSVYVFLRALSYMLNCDLESLFSIILTNCPSLNLICLYKWTLVIHFDAKVMRLRNSTAPSNSLNSCNSGWKSI